MQLILWLATGLGFLFDIILKVLKSAPVQAVFIRGLVIFALYVALPIVLYNVFASFLGDMIQIAIDFIMSNFTYEITVTFTNIGAYFYNELNLGQAFSMVLTAVAIRFVLSMVRGH